MEILIKLNKRLYKYANHHTLTASEIDEICDVIANGILLPEHHGRLIDGDKVLDEIEKQCPASVSETDKRKRYARLVYFWTVKNAPAIIEGSDSE